MKESHDEGPASHIDPESCVGDREAAGEALTWAHAGQVSSREESKSGTPTPLSEAEGNMPGGDSGESPAGPARSKTRYMRGISPHGNRETSCLSVEPPGQTPGDGESTDRSEKATSRASDANGHEESDGRVVPEQPAKEGGHEPEGFWALYEQVSAATAHREDEPASAGGRRPTEGNTIEAAAAPTQSGGPTASFGLDRVREVARRDKRARFTALLRHVSVELLRESFLALKRGAAPGVDGVTWQHYEVGLEERLVNLHRLIHTGTYRAQPSRRTWIPKSDGRMRPLGIAALEDTRPYLLKIAAASYVALRRNRPAER